MSRRPVLASYAYAKRDEECPQCRAAPHAVCVYPDGMERRAPCVSRLLKRPDPYGPDHVEDNRSSGGA
jgi:hypothetical protein